METPMTDYDKQLKSWKDRKYKIKDIKYILDKYVANGDNRTLKRARSLLGKLGPDKSDKEDDNEKA